MSDRNDSGDQPVIVVEDYFGSGYAGEFANLPHVDAALAEVRADPAKLDKLHQLVLAEMARRASG